MKMRISMRLSAERHSDSQPRDLAEGEGAGSQMLQPLAIAVIGGILISMVLSLVITPAVHFYLSPESSKSEELEAAPVG